VSELAVLPFLGKPIGTETAMKLIKVFDKNFCGTIDFYEFAGLHYFMMKMQQSFLAADTNRSGTLDSKEMPQALQSAGFALSSQTAQAICAKYDKTGLGVTFDKFLQIGAHLATVRSIFDWNDVGSTGKISLTYDQLSHITVHLMEK